VEIKISGDLFIRNVQVIASSPRQTPRYLKGHMCFGKNSFSTVKMSNAPSHVREKNK
jgi:hypothetical protein